MKHTKCIAIFCFLSIMLHSSLLAQQNKEVSIPQIPFKLIWENDPLRYSSTGNSLVIEAGPKTDMFRDPNATYNTDNAPKLLFTPDSNFVLTTAIYHNFKSKWDAGAIVLKADNKNWIKFAYEKDYKGMHRVVSVVTKDISDDCNSVRLNADKVFYRMAKAGKVITLYYSEDAKEWFLVRHFQFEASSPLQVGFLAQSPTGEHCNVTFSDIVYEAKKIKDPYMGE
jgi:regulation of enolase protein 1 (concanavalin A-like superfamily)